MVFNTATVAAAITPGVIGTAVSHVHTVLSASQPAPTELHPVHFSRVASKQAYCTYILRPRPASCPQLPQLCLEPYCRRATTLHSPKGPASILGQGRPGTGSGGQYRQSRSASASPARTLRHRASRRQALVAMASRSPPPARRVDRDVE